jgi:hypothetical protein
LLISLALIGAGCILLPLFLSQPLVAGMLLVAFAITLLVALYTMRALVSNG